MPSICAGPSLVSAYSFGLDFDLLGPLSASRTVVDGLRKAHIPVHLLTLAADVRGRALILAAIKIAFFVALQIVNVNVFIYVLQPLEGQDWSK